MLRSAHGVCEFDQVYGEAEFLRRIGRTADPPRRPEYAIRDHRFLRGDAGPVGAFTTTHRGRISGLADALVDLSRQLQQGVADARFEQVEPGLWMMIDA